MPSLHDVAALTAALPEVTVGERHGRLTWFVRGKAFAWDRPFSKADIKRYGDQSPPSGPILGISTAGLAEKEAVLAANPGPVFTIPHFDGYAAVLVQLELVTTPLLQELLLDAWLAVAPRALVAEHFPSGGRTNPG